MTRSIVEFIERRRNVEVMVLEVKSGVVEEGETVVTGVSSEW